MESFVCPSYYGCAGNGASMSFELDLSPQRVPNEAGFKITAIYPPPSPTYSGPMQLEFGDRLDMLIGKIRGVPPFTQARTFRNSELIGMKLRISRPPDEEYDVVLDGMDWFDFMVGDPPDRVTSYLFRFRPRGATQDALLCPQESDSATVSREHHHALVFRGDRYDPVTRKVVETDEPWINIACAGTAVAKLHLLRHTKAGSAREEYQTTPPEREAMLRMLRADYCGNGTTYTVDGTPLRYADHRGWHTDDLDVTQEGERRRVEALWNAGGAVCLETPRLAAREAIDCRLPRCHDLSDWQSDGHVLSVNPAEGPDQPPGLP